jgi:hypothetical protein
LDLQPPQRRRDAHTFRVIVKNSRGRSWTLAIATNADEAERRRDEIQRRIDEIGVDAWSREVRWSVPESFFD